MKKTLSLSLFCVLFGPSTITTAQNMEDFGLTADSPNVLPQPIAQQRLAEDEVLWSNRPISIRLQVGVERQVTFPAGVRVGLPGNLGHKLRTQSVDGTIHWLANEPFDVSRVQVKEIRSGRTYLIDLEALTDGGGVEQVSVVDAKALKVNRHIAAIPPVRSTYITPVSGAPGVTVPPPVSPINSPSEPMPLDNPDESEGPISYDLVSLSRYAAQQLYAPERLLSWLELPGISPVPVERKVIPLYRGGSVEVQPEMGWTDGVNYVTALRLRNKTEHTVVIDPRHIRGRWLARTVLYAQLRPSGDPYGRDQSFVFLISPSPFQESLQ